MLKDWIDEKLREAKERKKVLSGCVALSSNPDIAKKLSFEIELLDVQEKTLLKMASIQGGETGNCNETKS